MEHTDRLDAGDLERPLDPRRDRHGKGGPLRVAVLAALVAAVALAFWWWTHREAAAPPPAPPALAQAPVPDVAPQPTLTPPVRHPIDAVAPPAAESTAPVPALADSDSPLQQAMAGLFSAGTFDQLFYPDRIVRRIVATVDNLPRQSMSTDIRPVRPASGTFATIGPEGARQIGLDNARRYDPYVQALAKVDSRALVSLYVRFYPVFQQAYRELGYPNGYFNDRLVDAIDDALAAPVVEGPIVLQQPKVLYEFADPALQSLSVGQKAMVRIGPQNAAQVKAKLREIRALVASHKPAG
jgi:hypothetical protein